MATRFITSDTHVDYIEIAPEELTEAQKELIRQRKLINLYRPKKSESLPGTVTGFKKDKIVGREMNISSAQASSFGTVSTQSVIPRVMLSEIFTSNKNVILVTFDREMFITPDVWQDIFITINGGKHINPFSAVINPINPWQLIITMYHEVHKDDKITWQFLPVGGQRLEDIKGQNINDKDNPVRNMENRPRFDSTIVKFDDTIPTWDTLL